MIQKIQHTQKPPTLLQLFLWGVVRFILWAVSGCIGCISVAILLVALYGASALIFFQTLLQRDYKTMTALVDSNTLLLIYHWISVIPNTIALDNVSLPLFKAQYSQSIFLHLQPIIAAVLLALKLVIIKLYLLTRWFPLFLLLGFIGFVDGAAQRRIRRLSAGRESALIYHHIKALIMTSIVMGIFTDLVLPISFNISQLILIVSAGLFAFAIQVTAKSFKKYL